MIIYSAIDIRDGKCVRLLKGDFEQETIYGDDPVEMAMKWEQQGAEYLHVVDLDGARVGSPRNYHVIMDIIEAVKIPVQVGGGIRNLDTARQYLNGGVKRIILGTSAIKNPEMLKEAVFQFGPRVVVGVDSKDGFVAVDGWEKSSMISTIKFIKEIEETGVKTIIFTEISKDGTLEGPDIESTKNIIESVKMDVIASGGVGSIEDIKKLKDIQAAGVIIGKALYSGAVTMEQIKNLG